VEEESSHYSHEIESTEKEKEEQLGLKRPILIEDLDIDNLYKSEIEADEIFMNSLVKKAGRINKKENANLGIMRSPLLIQDHL
jgi:hypothetical protein